MIPKMRPLLPRLVQAKLDKILLTTPAVVLTGCRQVGKTTLAQVLAAKRDAIYLDLENPRDLVRLGDPMQFLTRHRQKLVVLDEIQRTPELFPSMRGIIDQNRRDGRRGEHYLLLGSASMDLLRQSSESLAGRIHYAELFGLNLVEALAESREDLERLWLRGGFPDSYLADDDSQAFGWLEQLIRTYLEREIPQFGFPIPATRLRRLWTMLAHLQGTTVNHSKLGGSLGIEGKTVSRYIDLLVDLLLVRRLEPWHVNVKKRLVKSPVHYVRDSGILHSLLGISSMDGLLGHPVLGKSWEGLVIENVHSVLPSDVQSYFYRTATGAEIDLLLVFPNSEIWAIEIKSGLAPKVSKGFHIACNDVQATRKFVVYGGNDSFPVAKDTQVISLRHLLAKFV